MKTLLFTLLTLAALQPGLFAQNQSPDNANIVAGGVVTDSVGNVYVLDLHRDKAAIYRYNGDGKRLCEVTETFPGDSIRSFTVDKRNGTIYFVVSQKIMRATPNTGGNSYQIDLFADTPFDGNASDEDIAVDLESNVYVNAGDRIIQLDPSGKNFREVVPNPKAVKLLGVDKDNCVYYSSGVQLWKAIPSSGGWRQTEVIPSLEANNGYLVAFSYPSNELYFAMPDSNGGGSIYMVSQTYGNPIIELPGHYGDLRGFALWGNLLYIANGTDGVLKVYAETGGSYSSKLFSVKENPDYFARKKNGDYYISCGGKIWQYDKNGKEGQEIPTNGAAGAVALDKDDNLLFFTKGINNLSDLHWQLAGKPDSVTTTSGPSKALTVAGDLLYFSTENSVRGGEFHGDHTWTYATAYKDYAEGLEGVAADKGEEVFYVDRKENAIWRATSVIFPNEKIISGLKEPRAIALVNRKLFVSNEKDQPHIGKYAADGKHEHISDVYSLYMKNIRDLVIEGNDVIVLQNDGVWKYSNTFAK